jgi:hypothetical protein
MVLDAVNRFLREEMFFSTRASPASASAARRSSPITRTRSFMHLSELRQMSLVCWP